MNKNCYRIVFNKARGQLMVVSEIAVSRTKGVKNSRGSGAPQMANFGLRPLTFWVWTALGMVAFSNAAQAQIVADKNAPNHQQATVLNTANGIPQVNIQTPSAAGVSRNTYSQFDVERRGAILNNSRNSVQTQIGGWVQGNPWLAGGSARVILNEVNSSNPSQLHGYIEVAGTRAQVVVANPSGITCNGCGFINANRATLTTGAAVLNSGSLDAYRVQGGEILITGSGMDATQTDYTDLIAQSVKVNAGIWANQLKVTTGTNQVNVDNTQTTVIKTNSAKPSYAIDVSQLGGMYAGKITLVGTEDGVGVRSIGNIAASAGDIIVTADGRIENLGNVSSQSNIRINSTNDIANSGSMEAQKNVDFIAEGRVENLGNISSNSSVKMNSTNDIANSGSIEAQNNIDFTAKGDITNQGFITSGQSTKLTTAGRLDNDLGEVLAVDSLSISASGPLSNQKGLLLSNQSLDASASKIINTQGTISSVYKEVNLQASAGALQNDSGNIEASQVVSIVAQGVSNLQGRIIASQLDIDTQLQALGNREGALIATGENGTGTLDVQSGAFDNHAGLIGATAALNINTNGNLLSNTDSGRNAGIVGQSTVTLATGQLVNQSGYIGSEADLNMSGLHIDNTQNGVMESSNGLTIDGVALNNSGGLVQSQTHTDIKLDETLNNTNGLIRSGQALTLSAAQLDNTQGELLAEKALDIDSSNRLNNTNGLISSATTATLHNAHSTDQALQIINTGGTVIANQKIDITSAKLTGDGELLSQGDISVKVTDDYLHTGLIKTNGQVRIETAATLTNQSNIQSIAEVYLKAATIDNQVNGQVSANKITLEATAANTLINRGLINGQETFIDTITLNNLGTGRIYGDHIAIEATTINNLAEGAGAPVIAARNQLDIGTKNLTNTEHGLIFSAGDLSIGGALDTNKNATGQATTVNNNSATIEALGHLNLASQSINNRNKHITTTELVLPTETVKEYQGSGASKRYLVGTPGVWLRLHESVRLMTPEGEYLTWLQYNYQRTPTQTTILTSDPGKILSGGNMTITADSLLNADSQVIAGGNLSAHVGSINNQQTQGRRVTRDVGTVTTSWRKKRDGRDTTRSSTAAYNPAAKVEAITLSTALYKQNTAPNGTGTQVAGLTTGVQTKTATANNGMSVVLPGNTTIIRTVGGNVELPNNRLYKTNPNPSAHYFIETDSAFTNNQAWLSSDYILDQLAFDPTITQKRLGDGFYEQKLIREQVAQLTGRRFLTGYATDEAQYQSLMNNAIDYAQQFAVTPGVALSADQMAKLTNDMVWMVEKEIAQPDGSVEKALVPQLYVRVQNTELAASGGLISADSMNLNLANDLINSGTIQASANTWISADNLRNLGGRIRGQDVNLQAQTDLNNLGGRITAQNSLQAVAGRDINLASTTNTQNGAQGRRTNIASVAEISVTGGTGALNISAGRDLSLKAVKLQNLSSGDTSLTAGQNLNLATVTESQDEKIVWDSSNWRSDSRKTETGSTIQTKGNLNLAAGQDLNARAAQVTSTGGDLNVIAGGNISLTAGENTQQVNEAHKHKNGGLIQSTEKSFDSSASNTAQITNLTAKNVGLQAETISLVGTDIKATEALNLTAKAIDITAVNDSNSVLSNSSFSDFMASKSAKNTNISSSNIASNLAAKDIRLNATEKGIQLTGSNIDATGNLILDSATDINVQAGYEGSLNESHKKESGWLTGGALFSESEDLEGKLKKSDVQSNIQAKNIAFNANKNLNLAGVNIQAQDSLNANAENITISHAEKEEKVYSKHTKLTVSVGDVATSLLRPDELINDDEDGKVSLTLAKATYDSADKVMTTTTAIASKLGAANINLSATTDQTENAALGNLNITGSDLNATGDINLTATNDLTVKEAKNSVVTKESEVEGKAELKLVVKNEYVLIKTAVEALQTAKSQLDDSQSSYANYQTDLKNQQANLAQLKSDLKNGKLGIEQVDVEELSEYVNDLKSDASFYQANIALATANLATKTTALAAQTAKAASSTGTYGFNAGLELDVDAIEKQLAAYEQSALASNITANNITLNSGEKTTLQGSHLNAKQNISINSQNLNVLASTNVKNSDSSMDHKNINVSVDLYGGGGAASVSVSTDSSKQSSKALSQNNSRLLASNIRINTAETTTIEGATVHADEQLIINTKNLNVASVQDSSTNKSQSQGLSAGFGSSGLNALGVNNAKANSKQKTTVQTSLTANQVDINTQQHTLIQGATIAAVDSNGHDNGQLNLRTQTLEAKSLNNTLNSRSQSLGLNASIAGASNQTAETSSSISSVGIDFSNDNSNRKTKTLATLGQGNLQIADSENSQTQLLNRDIQDNEVDIYNIESHKGLSGSLDTNLLTDAGRNQIAKDLNEFGQNIQKVAQGLPEADNKNIVVAAIGKALDELSSYTVGIIPSNGSNGGLLGNIPVMLGDKDINHKVLQVVTTDYIKVKNNPENFIPIEESELYQKASSETRDKLKGQGLLVSIVPVQIDSSNATYQNFTNGMMNSEADAIKNGIAQTGSKVVTINYNPSHGFIGDGLESGVDKLGIVTTGVAKQTGQFVNEATTARGQNGFNMAGHSQANLLLKAGIEYQLDNGGFKGGEYFINPNGSSYSETVRGIPTFSSFGSPVNTNDMKTTMNKTPFIYNGSTANPGDFVAEGLGGNQGVDQQVGAMDRLKSVVNVPKLFTDKSPHSSYECKTENGNKCGETP
ncbi:two-partner secretion domain-containing protein [Thiomicrorhabdus arctica]|uniref:two-partner secretion domain-containing protein n=1 Tax=Thiomicrorhabdus arctica TaxID=131540 RepID=UPI000370FC57|nr:hemagglutinin repeat-containing protein [Thiomicrorhabdus arctica]